MHEWLTFGGALLVITSLRLVLLRLGWGRRRPLPMPNAYLPPPPGHLAALAADQRTMTCPCGWRHALDRPATGSAQNRARLAHYQAVETERVARRLGVDAESMLSDVVSARELATQTLRAPELDPPAAPEPARNPFLARQARQASATERVEASRVLPRYTDDA